MSVRRSEQKPVHAKPLSTLARSSTLATTNATNVTGAANATGAANTTGATNATGASSSSGNKRAQHTVPDVALAPLEKPTSPASVRELSAHAKELGVDVHALAGDIDLIARAIQQAELNDGLAHDPRVSAADMERAVRWSQQAGALTPAKQSGLFGFTRVVDAKLSLDASTLEHLASTCDRGALLALVDKGPGDGGIAWKKPANPEELVASLVRQMILGDGASKQIILEPPLAKWLDDALSLGNITTKRAMGGAGAFAANIAAAVGVDAKFYSAEKMPGAIAERFSRLVKAVDANGESKPASVHSDVAQGARVNTAAEYGAGERFTLFGASDVVVNGAREPLTPDGSGRVILGTQAKDVVPGFAGVSDAALTKMAKSSDFFFFVGAHYLTQGDLADAKAKASELAADLDVMKRANPSLIRHLQYVVPKVPENEPVVLEAMRGHVESMSLNAVEAAPLVDALHDAGMTTFDVDPNLPREAAEDPVHMLEAATALVDALELQRLHFHGLEGDLVVSKPGAPGADDPERQKLALLKARQLAANKAANESGEIKSADDVWSVVPSVRGTGLAALHRFADALQQEHGLSDVERDLVVERWWFKDASTGTVIHFVPSRGIHDRSGGTVSLGDTIDSGALMYALPEGKTKKPRVLHSSTLAT